MAKQILLADDSATIARMVQITFAHEDYALTTVKTGDDAVSRARAARPDVILIDAGLPGKSGYDTCAELRAGGLTDVPVVILTSNFSPYDEARGQQAGADGHMVKPFETQALIDRVGQMIAQRGGGKPVAAAPPVQTARTVTPSPIAPAAPVSTLQNMTTSPRPAAPTPPPPRPSIPPAVVAPPVAAAPIPHHAPPPAPHAPPPPAAHAAPPPAAPPMPRPAPRATLMGLPTVGPDGMPVIQTSQGIIRPPVAAAPAVHSSPVAATMAMQAPSLPAAHAPAPTPAVDPFATDDYATRPNMPAAPPLHAAPPPAAPTAAAGPHSIPASAPKMPRPSLVPRAPTARAQAAIDAIAGRGTDYGAIARLSREVIEQIAWEVVPELAEAIVRTELDRLVKERNRG